MNRWRRSSAIIVMLVPVTTTMIVASISLADEVAPVFESDIQPIPEQNCTKCH